jgi:hypothetical protein
MDAVDAMGGGMDDHDDDDDDVMMPELKRGILVGSRGR